MPGGDRTGPMGRGPLTGRGLGYCGGASGRYGGGGDFGRGRGGGMGRGRRHRNWAPDGPGWAGYGPWAGPGRMWAADGPAVEEELRVLRSAAAGLEQELGRVRARLEELEQTGPDDE